MRLDERMFLMTNFRDVLLKRIKTIINSWNEDGIYAISFFVNCNEAFEYNGFNNISTFAISYNTEEDCSGAGQYDEERWNYAFWRQDESTIIDPDDPDSLISQLFEWYKENNIQNIGYERCYEYFEGRGLLNILTLRKKTFLKRVKNANPNTLGKFGKFFQYHTLKKKQ